MDLGRDIGEDIDINSMSKEAAAPHI